MYDFTINIIYYSKFFKTASKTVLREYLPRLREKLPEIRELTMRILEGKSSGHNLQKKLKGYNKKSKQPIYKCRVGQNFRLSYQLKREEKNGLPIINMILLRFTPHDTQGRDNLRMAIDIEEEQRLIQEGEFVRDGELVIGLEDDDGELEQKWGPVDSIFKERMYINVEEDFNDLVDYVSKSEQDVESILYNELLHMLESKQLEAVHYYNSDVVVDGSAGSGKSLVGLNWLQKQRSQGAVQYLTFATKLCEKMEKQQQYYEGFIDYQHNKYHEDKTLHSISFMTTHNWFLGQVEERDRYLSSSESYESFKQWYLEQLGEWKENLDNDNLEDDEKKKKKLANRLRSKKHWDLSEKAKRKKYRPEDVWSEIRGVIKGHMGRKCLRGCIFRDDPPLKSVLKLLEKANCLEKQKNTNWRITEDAIQNDIISWKQIDYTKIAGMTQEHEKTILAIQQYIQKSLFEVDSGILPRDVYIGLPKDYSIFDQVDRKKLYDIAEEYHLLRCESAYRDDIDLALDVIKQSGKLKDKGNVDSGALFIDEAQDLTELQLFTLICLNQDKSIMFAADQKQIINPTYFNTGRLEETVQALRNNNREFSKVNLRKNWRCTAKLVEFENYFCQLRNREDKLSRYEDAEAIGDNGNSVIWIEQTPENDQRLEHLFQEKGGKINILLCDNTDFICDKVNIYSIQECKGNEFATVLVWNVMGIMEEAWSVLKNDKGSRKNPEEQRSRLRLAINLFYVAFTRARKTLVIYESSKSAGADLLYEAVKAGHCEKWDSIDEQQYERLCTMIDDITSEQLLAEAHQDEENGAYGNAARKYRQINDCYNEIRCNAKVDEQDRRFSDAMRKYLQLERITDVKKLCDLCDEEVVWVAAKLVILNDNRELDNEAQDYINEMKQKWCKKFPSSNSNFEELMIVAAQESSIAHNALNDYVDRCGSKLNNLVTKITEQENAIKNKIDQFYTDCRRMRHE